MKRALLLASIAGALTATGCAVGPDFRAPAAPSVQAVTMTNDFPSQQIASPTQPQFDPQASLPADWWTLLGNETVNRLVEAALNGNPNLVAASAALKIAQANAKAERAAFFPGLSAGFDATRQQTSGALSPVLSDNRQTFNLFTPQVTVSYSLDMFGGTRRTVEAADANARGQEFSLQAAHLMLAANMAVAAVQLASLSDQMQAQGAIVHAVANLRDLLQDQVARGAASSAALAAQEALLAQAQAALAGLQKQFAQQQDLLAALSGKLPAEFSPVSLSLAELALPKTLPQAIPAELVRRRPDVRMAEENLHAANAQVGAAVAAMLPNITLSASNGSAASAAGMLFGPGAGFWSLGAGVLQPLFQGGALLARKRAADAALDQAKAEYQGAVVTAFQNTADTLEALNFDSQALASDMAAESAAQLALRRAQHQQVLGDIGATPVLLAEQTYDQARLTTIQARATCYADTIALFEALGGGW